jgi:hypothetical protein
MAEALWRRWMPGPKRGLPRGVAVFGSPGQGLDPDHLAELFGSCERLRGWADAHGRVLRCVPDDLAWLDRAIGRRAGNPQQAAILGAEAGLFLASVITATIPGAHWRVWPNGHPVVRTPAGRELDVVAVAHDRLAHGQPLLAAYYANAAA